MFVHKTSRINCILSGNKVIILYVISLETKTFQNQRHDIQINNMLVLECYLFALKFIEIVYLSSLRYIDFVNQCIGSKNVNISGEMLKNHLFGFHGNTVSKPR